MKSAARVAALVLIIVALSSIGLLDKAAASLLQSPTNPGTTNLVSWWALDETSGTRADAHGSNSLTDNNTVGYAAGVQGNAAYFVSANLEYLSIADNASFSFGTGSWTSCGWVSLHSKDQDRQVWGKYEPGGNQREWHAYYIKTSDQWALRMGSDGTSGTLSSVRAENFGSPPLDTFSFLCGGYNSGNQTMEISVNAGTPNTWSFTSGLFDGTGPFLISSNSSSYRGDGNVDELAIFTKHLTADELTWLYNSGSGRRYCEVANNCPEYQTATAAANQTGTANALTATYDAQLTGTAGALTATYYPMLTGTASALTATQVFSDDLQTVIAGYRTQRAALTYTPTVTLTATLTGTPNPAAQFESTISYGDVARFNALACIATIGGLWAIVWAIVTFFSRRRRA